MLPKYHAVHSIAGGEASSKPREEGEYRDDDSRDRRCRGGRMRREPRIVVINCEGRLFLDKFNLVMPLSNYIYEKSS